MITKHAASRVGDLHDAVGESPYWDAASGGFSWVDIPGQSIHQIFPDGDGWRSGPSVSTPGPVGVIVPRAAGGTLAGVGTTLYAVDADGGFSPFTTVETGTEGARFNDGKADPAGRLLVSWMGEDSSGTWGALCRVEPDGSVVTVLDGLGLPNGLDWSPDGRTFYFADTLAMAVDAFDYDIDSGGLSNRRRAITLEPGQGMPDGLTVDAEGNIWLAAIWSGQVRAYSPSGDVIAVVETPSLRPTSCAFGGSDLDTLFITSLDIAMPEFFARIGGVPGEVVAATGADPDAGGVFAARPGAIGKPPYAFAG